MMARGTIFFSSSVGGSFDLMRAARPPAGSSGSVNWMAAVLRNKRARAAVSNGDFWRGVSAAGFR